jgi:hypothetical protein
VKHIAGNEAGMSLMAKEMGSKSRDSPENEETYTEFCGIVSRRCPSMHDASTDEEEGSAIPASSMAYWDPSGAWLG